MDYINDKNRKKLAGKFRNYKYFTVPDATADGQNITDAVRLGATCFRGPPRKDKKPAYIRDNFVEGDQDEWTDEEEYLAAYDKGTAPLDCQPSAQPSVKVEHAPGRSYKVADPYVLHLAQQGVHMSVAGETVPEHIAAAQRFVFPQISAERLPLDLQEAILFTADAPCDRQAARRLALDYWAEAKKRLQVTTWAADRPEITRVEVNLLREMMRVTGIFGEKMLHRLEFGWPILGIFDEPTVFERKNRARPIRSKAQLVAQRGRILEEIRRISARESAEEAELVWSSLVEECESGSLEGPFCLDDEEGLAMIPEEFLPIRRFIVTQMSYSASAGGYKIKHRPCDNAKRSELNSGCAVRTPIQLQSGDDLNASALWLRKLLNAKGEVEALLSLIKKDKRRAYRHLLTCLQHQFVVVVARNPADGRLYGAKARALLFGEEPAVINFNVYALVATALGRRILRLPLTSYFDDFAAPVRAEDEKQASADMDEFYTGLLRITFEKDKDETGPRIRFLGSFHTLVADGVWCEICPVRAGELLKTIRRALGKNCLRPVEAESLAGSLSFCARSAYGKIGRAFLVPIYGRAHASHQGGLLGERLRRALLWFDQNLATFRFHLSVEEKPPPVIIYTDASGPGLLGICLIDGDARLTCSVWSKRIGGDHSTIELYEAEAVLAAMEIFHSKIRGRRVLFLIDNESAQCATQNGASDNPAVADVVHEIWSTALRLGLEIWLERVASAANAADGPSRDDFGEVLALGFTLVSRALVSESLRKKIKFL